jgi:hypothetical protein
MDVIVTTRSMRTSGTTPNEHESLVIPGQVWRAPGEYHMVADYDFRRQRFRAEREPTVAGPQQWQVVKRAHVR